MSMMATGCPTVSRPGETSARAGGSEARSILVERSSGLGRRPSGSALWRSAVYSVPAGSLVWPALLGFGPLRRLVRATFVSGRGGHDLADDADCYVRQPACGALNRVL